MINSMNRHTPIRMMGLASGMDTDMIVQQTLRLHQFRIDNRMRDRTLVQWRQETHNSLRQDIENLRRTFMSNLGSSPLVNRNAFNSTTSTVTGANASAVSVSTLTGSSPGNLRIDRVNSLARGASMASSRAVSQGGTGFNPQARLDSLTFAGNQRIEFNADVGGGNTVSLDSVRNATWSNATATLNIPSGDPDAVHPQLERDGGIIRLTFGPGDGDFVELPADSGEAIENFEWDGRDFMLARAEDGTVSVTELASADPDANNANLFSVNINSNAVQWTQTATVGLYGPDGLALYEDGVRQTTEITRMANTGSTDNIRLGDNMEGTRLAFQTSLTFGTGDNAVNVTINSHDTINQMTTAVNRSGAGVTMTYDRLTDRFTFESNTIGDTSTISVQNGANAPGDLMRLLAGVDPDDLSAPANFDTQDGSRASVTINGETIMSYSNTIDFRGVRITLNETTGADDPPINVSFRRDAEEPFNRIRDFINAYNEIVQRLETLTSERQSRAQRTYRPLTRDEMANMSEREIEDWNSVARIGIMRNDPSLERLTVSIRRAFFDEIQGMGMSASQIGLSTGRHSEGTGGQIIIDEDRLRAALESDPDMVADIFARIESGPDGPQGVGLIHRLDSLFGQFVNVSQPDSLRGLEDSLRRTNEQIERMEARMFAEEDRLFRQFAAMEVAMSNMQNQGQWFNSMLGMG